MSRRVCLISFDSPDFGTLARTLEEGRLPILERILREGRYVELNEHQDLISNGCWVTLTTGLTSPEHGVLINQQLVEGSYRTAPIDRDVSDADPFWAYAGKAGLRSTVIGTYAGKIVAGLPGKQVVGWGMHDSFARDRWSSSPPDLVHNLEREFGPRKLRYHQPVPRTHDDQRRYVTEMLESIGQQERVLCALLEDDDWDFFCAPFGEAHQAGHWLWHHSVKEHPDHDPDAPAELLDALPALYERTDRAVGELWSRLPDDAVLMVTTPYGLTIANGLYRVTQPVLDQGGLTVRRSRDDGPVIVDRRLRALQAARAVARKVLPLSLRWRLSPAFRRDHMAGALLFADVDWSRTRAFSVPSDRSGYVRLNLAGREPEGIVDPGGDYDRACAEVEELFMGLRALDGTPVVQAVERMDRVFSATPDGPMPDLVVRYADVPHPPGVFREGHDPIEVPPPLDARTAAHAAPGFLAAVGDGIETGGATELSGPSAKMIDVAPTVLAALGVDPPAELSGRAIPELVPRAASASLR